MHAKGGKAPCWWQGAKKQMIDRNEVAREKIARAKEMLGEQGIDMWVFYSRLKQDPALELVFNTDTQNEALFAIVKNGGVYALAPAQDAPRYKESGLYTEVIETDSGSTMGAFKAIYEKAGVQRMALNTSEEDSRCDGLGVGLYRKLEAALGAEEMARVATGSFAMLEELRAVKTPSEIAIMRECSVITTDIYDVVFQKVCVGMSETDVGDIMMEELRKRGLGTAIGDPTDYPLILLVKGGMSHRKPNPKNICQPGDMLVIDFSVRYNGYTSDIARTMYFLKPDEAHAPQEVQDCANAAIRAVGEVLKVIKPGMKGYEVDAVGRQSILDSGYPNIPHSVGHQVGLEVHDGGTTLGQNKVRPTCGGVLRKNEIYAIEPTVLQPDGLPCAIIEDDVLLTDDGCELISKRQTALIEIPYRVKV